MVREHPPPARPELGPPTAELAFRATDLGMLRQLTAEIGGQGGLEPDRVADAVLAVNELASNSVEHGPGAGGCGCGPTAGRGCWPRCPTAAG